MVDPPTVNYPLAGIIRRTRLGSLPGDSRYQSRVSYSTSDIFDRANRAMNLVPFFFFFLEKNRE